MKTTLKIAFLTALLFTTTLADGQQGTGGRTCPPECTIDAPENCPPNCQPGGRPAPESKGKIVMVETVTRLARMYFLGF